MALLTSDLKRLSAVVGVAAALGVGATVFALRGDPSFDAVQFGAWTAWPRLGGPDIDPYGRASVALQGALPLGSGEGIAFSARADDAGASLDARCDYVISGPALGARFWTLTAYDIDGRLRANAAGRYGLTSTALLRASDGSFVIAASREARPGNWLPLGERSRFTLVLRAYEANLIGGFQGLQMPTITRGECS